MTLLSDICRGLYEAIRETLPSNVVEQKLFLSGFYLTLGLQLVIFTVLEWTAGSR